MSNNIQQLVDHLFRHQAGQIVAILTRIFGPQHLDLAEDVVQETLIKALRQWPYCGVPDNPAAWIMRVARNQALDIIRRERSLPARTDEEGDLLLLAEQDRSLWDRQLIVCGLGALDRAAQDGELSEYHLQAGIAACHALAPTYAATDWPRILWLYDALAEIAPSPIVALNRAVALSMVDGTAAGLAELDRLRGQPGIDSYPLLHATYGTFWRQAGDTRRAAASFRRALGLVGSAPERRFLQRKLGECGG